MGAFAEIWVQAVKWSYSLVICLIFGSFCGNLDASYKMNIPNNATSILPHIPMEVATFSHLIKINYTVTPAADDPMFSISDTDISIWYLYTNSILIYLFFLWNLKNIFFRFGFLKTYALIFFIQRLLVSLVQKF